MNTLELKARLYWLAVKGFKSARRHNPFWSTTQAKEAVVMAFTLAENHQ